MSSAGRCLGTIKSMFSVRRGCPVMPEIPNFSDNGHHSAFFIFPGCSLLFDPDFLLDLVDIWSEYSNSFSTKFGSIWKDGKKMSSR
ncbi:hypothetical protein AVEN_100757-1, partial [Araneus ventricosus]